MKYKITFLFILLGFFLIIFAHSQPTSAYKPFTSKAPIPREFLATSTEKYEEDIQKIPRDSSRNLRRTQANFYLESSFMVDGLLKKGRVLFNDEAGIYVNKIADQILRDQPNLRSKLRFYIVKSPIPNAFTTQQGTILINMGLLARLQTEAQLAYILCHEIAHFQKKHVLNRYIEFKAIELQQGNYKTLENYDKLLAKSNYSKAHETEADLEGFELFKKAGYGTETIPGVFDILADASLAMLFRPDNYSHLFSSHYSQEDWKNMTLEPSDAKDNSSEEEDEKEETDIHSTHPEPMARKQAIEGKIQEWKNNPGGGAFVVSAEDFISVKDNAKFAVIDFYLSGGMFLDALHQILALMTEYPDDFYLKKSLAHALYSIAKYRSHEKSMWVLLDYSNIPADLKFIETFQSIGESHIQVMAISYIWDFMQNHQKDAVTGKAMIHDLLFDIHDALRQKGEDDKKEKEMDPYTAEKLNSLNQNPDFKTIYDAAKDEQSEFSDFISYINTRQGRAKYNRYRNKQQNKGYHLGIDKVVVFDPLYYSMDLTWRSKNMLEFVKSEKELVELHDMIHRSADKLGLNVEIVDSKILTNAQNFQAFEDYSQITQWHQQWNREAEFRFVPSNYDKILEMSDRYGTPYFMQMGAIAAKFPRATNPNRQRTINFGLFLPSTWPLSLLGQFQPEVHSAAFAVVYDIKNNRRLMSRYTSMEFNANKRNIAPHVYFNLKQVKRSK